MQRHIAVCHRDHGDLQLVRPRGESEQYSEDIVNPCTKRQSEQGARGPGARDSLPGSVSMIIRFFGAMACLGSEIDLRPSQREARVFHVDLALCLCLCLCLCICLRLPAIPMRWNRSKGTVNEYSLAYGYIYVYGPRAGDLEPVGYLAKKSENQRQSSAQL